MQPDVQQQQQQNIHRKQFLIISRIETDKLKLLN